MSLKLLIVTALFLLVLTVAVSSGTFCDEGPPGRYCFKDLSGWYECTIDSKQQMTEKKHKCPLNERCQCFYGPDCPSTVNNPCASYQLPPPFPEVFSSFYTLTITHCDSKGCTNVTHIGELLQNATAGEQRHDRVGKSWETSFIFPFRYIGKNNYLQFDAAWFEKNCSFNSLPSFPRFQVPSHFTCDKQQVSKTDGATFRVCSWQSGGRSKTEEVIIEKWLLLDLQDGRFIPVAHEVQMHPSPSSNTTVLYDTMFPSFFPDFLDPNQLSMPAFCTQDVVSPVTSMRKAEENEPAINVPHTGCKGLTGIEANQLSRFYEKLGLQKEE